jgi:hypothetical protein
MKTTMCRRLAPWNGIMCKKLRTLDSDLSHTITFVTLRIAIAQEALERADRAAFDVDRFEEKRMGYISRPSWRRATQLAALPTRLDIHLGITKTTGSLVFTIPRRRSL